VVISAVMVRRHTSGTLGQDGILAGMRREQPWLFVDDDAGDAAIDCIAHAGRRFTLADAPLIGGVRYRVGSRV